ncbi:MAG: FkbM family methyltransferase [Acidobacteria bacterium]|nr:FkbM family methyltransferase [Acidobacteriota bacterium]MCA1649614.1 FkbM family methyltransferase [Acidobacteriota bacterium]
MTQGRGNAYRTRSRLERAAAGLRSVLPQPLTDALRGGYHKLLATSAADRFVCTLPEGERVRVLPQYGELTWNPEEYAAFGQAVAPGTTVLDIGANLGAYTLLFALWVRESGRVFAFEPAPESFAGLLAHVALNGLADRVAAQQLAVSDTEGLAAFQASGRDGANRIVAAADGSPDILQVGSTSVDAFCRKKAVRPGFIKIDVEGAELQVLQGARETIGAAGEALHLFVELHRHLWEAFGASRAALEAEFRLQGLRPERLDGHPNVWDIEGVCLRLRRCGS